MDVVGRKALETSELNMRCLCLQAVEPGGSWNIPGKSDTGSAAWIDLAADRAERTLIGVVRVCSPTNKHKSASVSVYAHITVPTAAQEEMHFSLDGFAVGEQP